MGRDPWAFWRWISGAKAGDEAGIYGMAWYGGDCGWNLRVVVACLLFFLRCALGHCEVDVCLLGAYVVWVRCVI